MSALPVCSMLNGCEKANRSYAHIKDTSRICPGREPHSGTVSFVADSLHQVEVKLRRLFIRFVGTTALFSKKASPVVLS
jgi:hypothetical protein